MYISTGDYTLPAPTTYPTVPTFAPVENTCNSSQAIVTVRFQQLSTQEVCQYQLLAGGPAQTWSLYNDLYDMIVISHCLEWNACYAIRISMDEVADDVDIDKTVWIMIENGQTYQEEFSADEWYDHPDIQVCKQIMLLINEN